MLEKNSVARITPGSTPVRTNRWWSWLSRPSRTVGASSCPAGGDRLLSGAGSTPTSCAQRGRFSKNSYGRYLLQIAEHGVAARFVPTRLPVAWWSTAGVRRRAWFFYESPQREQVPCCGGPGPVLVQANVSRSARGVLRGLHYQSPRPAGKLVSALGGGLRRGGGRAPRLAHLRPVGGVVPAQNKAHHFWIPEGFAHGFVVLSEDATFAYQ